VPDAGGSPPNRFRHVRRFGVDVGGTNTDAVLLEDGRVVHAVKTPTSTDVTGGIVAALELLGRHPQVARGEIDGVVIGTTHFVNAVVQRRHLTRVAAGTTSGSTSDSTHPRQRSAKSRSTHPSI
jgi:N-methylhydantoinase A/oxoprolinase/acetone carboxylase beta subunit